MTHDALAMIEYRNDPALLVLADSEAAGARVRKGAEAAGCRVAAVVPIAGGPERLDMQVRMDAVVVEVEADHGPELDRLLDRLESAARSARHPSVVIAPPELTDAVAARTPHADVHHLCAPTDAERAAAIAFASAPRPARLHDVKGQGPARLQQLSEEVGRIASILASLSETEGPPDPAADEESGEDGVSASAIRAIIRARRLRERFFPSDLFADPAWDMLLDLMAARLEKKPVAVSSLCIAAAVPATTALRWIKALTDQGVFVRAADPHDGRRVFIELSDRAAAQLAAYLKALSRLAPGVV